MFSILLILHSWFRWLVLLSLITSIVKAAHGLRSHRDFSKRDNALRHGTATIAHIQLLIGMTVYIKSPLVAGPATPDSIFFKFFHIACMITAILCITLGSALAKRKSSGNDKFKTMLAWFSIALGIILIAIPWPFSPLSARPLIR